MINNNVCVACLTRDMPRIPVMEIDKPLDLWFIECKCPECGVEYLVAVEKQQDKSIVSFSNVYEA